MDNICHTLVGVAAARAGLNTKTSFATATLAISANLPDIDVLAFATGIPPVALRRGWTHGVIAQLVLPVLFALVMHAWSRRKGRPAHLPWLIALSYIGVFTHVFLDYLNTYGVRLLMPVSNEWFYGDAVFIVDPWLWLALGIGAFFARRGQRAPARAGLAIATIYIVAMLASARAARGIVEDRWIDTMGSPPTKLMVGPVPVNPFRKTIIVEAGDRYLRGTFSWYPRDIRFDPAEVPKNDRSPLIDRAKQQEPDFNAILVWSRFPYWQIEAGADAARVSLNDLRFPERQATFGASTTLR
jgi:inner membrane protein